MDGTSKKEGDLRDGEKGDAEIWSILKIKRNIRYLLLRVRKILTC